MKLDVDFSELHQTVAKMVPEPTIHDLHSAMLETFLMAIEKQMDFEHKNADPNHFISSAVDCALVRLYNDVRCAQVSAIERETGA